MGYFDSKHLQNAISESVRCQELGVIPVHYDTMANMSFMSPVIFDKLKHLQVKTKTGMYIKTGSSQQFIVNKYIPLTLYNMHKLI